MSALGCSDGIHHFRHRETCNCGCVTHSSQKAEGREGMVTVYDYCGHYVGCMGIDLWNALLKSASTAHSPSEPA
jgi:hypothetical protein